MDRIHEQIWQGGMTDVTAAEKVVDLLVDLTRHRHYRTEDLPPGVNRTELPMRDGPLSEEVSLQVHRLVESLADKVRDGTTVFVHCASGINRSGLVGALLLRDLEDVPGPEAIKLLEKRTTGRILSNSSFRRHVEELGRP